MFDILGEKAKAVTCPAIDGIIKEANETAGDIADKAVLDAALIASAQAVEHYEITRYGTLIAWADQLGRSEVSAHPGRDAGRGEGDRREADGDGDVEGQREGRGGDGVILKILPGTGREEPQAGEGPAA